MTRFLAIFIWLLAQIPAALWAEGRVSVFAAASLRGALEDIIAGYDGQVTLSFGGSGTMARQIAAGSPADVVVLASPLWMEWLASQGIIDRNAAVAVAANRLVLIGPATAPPMHDLSQLMDRLKTGRLAMGHRDAVPAGGYARQALETAGLWRAVQNHLAETDNVRAALAMVARGQTPLGIVYATDAQAEPRVKVLLDLPPEGHDPILYPAAAVTPAGLPFLHHLAGPDAAALFAAHGFQPVVP